MSIPQVKERESKPLFKWLITLILIALCIWAAQWQFQRGIDRQDRNAMIESQLTRSVLNVEEVPSKSSADLERLEWRTVSAAGIFQSDEQILLKNRYFEGVYGFEVLTRFALTDGRFIWVNRGWVKAGKDAQTAPTLTPVPSGEVSVIATGGLAPLVLGISESIEFHEPDLTLIGLRLVHERNG